MFSGKNKNKGTFAFSEFLLICYVIIIKIKSFLFFTGAGFYEKF